MTRQVRNRPGDRSQNAVYLAGGFVVLQQQPSDVREQLLQAATHLLAERGYEGTALQDIAERVKVRKQSLLHYFPSKDALREAVLEELLARWKDVLPRVLLAASSGDDQFDGVMRELIGFFTAGEAKPAQSWHLKRGLTAWHAAGEIHSDIQRGFIRAEVVSYAALTGRGSMAACKEHGEVRLEGKEYVVQDGDIINFRHAT